MTRYPPWLAALAAVLALAGGASAAPLVLCTNGQARAAIVLPAAPTALERYAADELAAYLRKMTGATFAVQREGAALPAGRAVIAVGRTRLAGTLAMGGTPAQRANREAFRVLRRGTALLIAGNRAGDAPDLGALWGVYGLLQRLGAGWYLPDPLFEVVPTRPTLAIDALDLTDAPTVGMRGGGGQQYGIPPQVSQKSPLAGYASGYPYGGREVWFSHMFSAVLTPEVLRANPDFTRSGLCLTNPALRQLFVDYTRGQFAKYPGLYASSLFPDDTLGPTCGCPECRQLLALKPATLLTDGAVTKTDYLVDFYNGVARGLAKAYPGRKVIGAAYLDYIEPPARTRVDPNVIILIAPLTDQNEVHPNIDRLVQGWRDMGARELYWYGYDMGREPMPNEIARRFRNYRRWNLQGIYIENRPNLAVSGINYYLESRLSWNWNASVDDLLQEFCDRLFGPQAGRVMANFFYAWEQQQYPAAEKLVKAAGALAAGDPVAAKRVRYFDLGLQMVVNRNAMLMHLKNEGMAADLGLALFAARRCVAARDAINKEYGPRLAQTEYDPVYGNVSRKAAAAIPMLEHMLAFAPAALPPAPAAPGPPHLLTDNADEPAAVRLAAGVTVRYDPPPNYAGADYPTGPSKLFNGGADATGNTAMHLAYPPDGRWTITLDLQQPYAVDRVDLWLRSAIPLYVDVLAGSDGTNFQPLDELRPFGQVGWHRTRELGVAARYLRLDMVTLDWVHAVHQVKIWGRPLAR